MSWEKGAKEAPFQDGIWDSTWCLRTMPFLLHALASLYPLLSFTFGAKPQLNHRFFPPLGSLHQDPSLLKGEKTRFAQQLGSHIGAKVNAQISGLQGVVAQLCPSWSWLSHVPRLAGNPDIALQCRNGERLLLKSQTRSARGWPVLWGRVRREKPSTVPRDVGDTAGSRSRAFKGAEASLGGAAILCYSTQPSTAAAPACAGQ